MCLYLCAYVIFVSRAVCHVLTYTAYTHAHTTHTCSNIVVESRLTYVECIEMIIEFSPFFVILFEVASASSVRLDYTAYICHMYIHTPVYVIHMYIHTPV